MKDVLEFANRDEFRKWLSYNCLSNEGVWILFRKSGEPKTIKANKTYKKYFSMRRQKSKWSEKNKALAESLEERGLMTEYGRNKMEEAKNNGQWNAPKALEITEKHILEVLNVLKEYELAYKNFQSMSPSVKKTYTKAYFDAKTDKGRKKRIDWMVDRLNKNLKPM